MTSKSDGSLLPFQIIYGGKTEKSLPKREIREPAEKDGHIFCVSVSHWQTVKTFMVGCPAHLPDVMSCCQLRQSS